MEFKQDFEQLKPYFDAFWSEGNYVEKTERY